MTEKEKKAQITQAHIDGYNRGYAKAKADLETENNKLLDVINNQDVKIADLEQQIEKMKNCYNCAGYYTEQCLGCEDYCNWELRR